MNVKDDGWVIAYSEREREFRFTKKSAAKFHYIKTVSGRVVAQSIAFRAVSICWQGELCSLDI